MFDNASPTHSDLAYLLPADAYYHLVRKLRLTLPPPLTDSAEDLLRRDHAAIARIAALAPANAAEADVAAQFVAASEQWMDCLRLAQEPGTTPEWAAKCRAQALSMMRQANSALRMLLRAQDARRKLEADDAARDRLAWTEHVATRLLAEAFAAHPEIPAPAPAPCPPSEPEAASAEAGESPGGDTEPAPVAKPQPAPALLSGAAETLRLRQTDPALIAAAERYAVAYPERAAEIRRTGKLLCDVVYFDPPEAALSSALIAGRTPALAALDHGFPETGAA